MPKTTEKHEKLTYVTFLWDDTMVLGDNAWHSIEAVEVEPAKIPVCGMLLKETKKYLLLGLSYKHGGTVGNIVQIPKCSISNFKRHKFHI